MHAGLRSDCSCEGHAGQSFRLARPLGEEPRGLKTPGYWETGLRTENAAAAMLLFASPIVTVLGVLRSCPYAVALPFYADWGVTSEGDFTF